MSAPLAITMGEPAGVGPDIILDLYARRAELGLPPFVVFGNLAFLEKRAARLGLATPIAAASAATAISIFREAMPVIDVTGLVPDHPGEISPLSARSVINSITQAVDATLSGRFRAVVTAPIHKGALYHAGFSHPGHTEFLAELCARDGKVPLPVMMLAHDALRTVPLTIHVPLSAVPGLINRKLILVTLRVMAHDLRQRFGIEHPRVAVTGLNPHAGEGGSIGREDLEIIAPAIADAQAEGIDASGPHPADTVFFPAHWSRYDAVLAMYHDQALIPIKTVAFDEGVNITLGLPIVRTSPDHGTAFDLAGTGKASSASFAAAIRMADRMTESFA